MAQRTALMAHDHFGKFLRALVDEKGGPAHVARELDFADKNFQRWQKAKTAAEANISAPNQQKLRKYFGYESWERFVEVAEGRLATNLWDEMVGGLTRLATVAKTMTPEWFTKIEEVSNGKLKAGELAEYMKFITENRDELLLLLGDGNPPRELVEKLFRRFTESPFGLKNSGAKPTSSSLLDPAIADAIHRMPPGPVDPTTNVPLIVKAVTPQIDPHSASKFLIDRGMFNPLPKNDGIASVSDVTATSVPVFLQLPAHRIGGPEHFYGNDREPDEYMVVPVPEGHICRIVQLDGDCMYSDDPALSYPHGCRVLVDSTAVERAESLQPGAAYYIQLRGEQGGKATFKRYIGRGDDGAYLFDCLNKKKYPQIIEIRDNFNAAVAIQRIMPAKIAKPASGTLKAARKK